MNSVLVLLLLVVVGGIALTMWSSSRATGSRAATSLADAKADARRVIEREQADLVEVVHTLKQVVCVKG